MLRHPAAAPGEPPPPETTVAAAPVEPAESDGAIPRLSADQDSLLLAAFGISPGEAHAGAAVERIAETAVTLPEGQLALLLASVGAPANGIGAAPAHGPLYAPLLPPPEIAALEDEDANLGKAAAAGDEIRHLFALR